uniref:Mvd1 C-terminal domain-containing protein n=1 Tax=Acrobeloides nanus TaxID=290746 RepID=A0A914E1Z1_9BILA
ASSASGFAAIAFAFGQLFHLPEKEVVRLARLGSGSACRSILGGFVHWKAGFNEWDSTCESLFPSTHWPNLRAVIIVCSTTEKDIGSTVGMKASLATSSFMRTRVEEDVPVRVKELISAVEYRNFRQLAEITMRESDQLHAICLDTWPPLLYLNESSRQIMRFVHAFNAHFGTCLAYTFDAGPNAILLMEDETFPIFMQTFVKACDFKLPKSIHGSSHSENIGLESDMPKLFPEPIQVDIRDMFGDAQQTGHFNEFSM